MRYLSTLSIDRLFTLLSFSGLITTAFVASLDAQSCSAASFTAATPVAVGAYPTAIAAGDFDENGNSDLAIANYAGNSVSIVSGTGDGGFLPAVNFGNVNAPFAIATGDFDLDGHLDLAVANSTTNDISVLNGDGVGGMSLLGRFPVGNSPFSVAAIDLNGDGAADLIATNHGSHTVSVMMNNGLGGFLPAASYPAGMNPISIAAGDLDLNGTIDVVVANDTVGTVSVLLGDGTGALALGVSYPVGSFPETVVTGDFNGDGSVDIAAANAGSSDVSILINDGNGTFGPMTNWAAGNTPFGAAVWDFNQDGFRDIVTANFGSANLSVLLGAGDGSFAPAANFAAGLEPGSVIAADLNGDGSNDLAIANRSSNNVSILLNDCAGNSTPSITAIDRSRAEGSVAARSVIATVSDTEDDEASLGVSVNGGDSATANGVTVSNIATDSSGNVEADVIAACGAENAAFTLRVTDSGGSFSETVLNVTVTSNSPPFMTLAAPAALFPHNGRMHQFQISEMVVNATDDCDGDLSSGVTVESVSSDEGPADSSSDDILIAADCRSVFLRASRDKKGDGRVYSVVLTATDSSGNVTRETFKITVPINPNRGPAQEGPPVVTVFSACK